LVKSSRRNTRGWHYFCEKNIFIEKVVENSDILEAVARRVEFSKSSNFGGAAINLKKLMNGV